MTLDQVVSVVGPAYIRNQYANGTTVWTYRYYDVGIAKLLHVTLDPSGRLLRYETESGTTLEKPQVSRSRSLCATRNSAPRR